MSLDLDSRQMRIVFDLGGVLIDWNPRYLYRQLFAGDDEAMEQFLGQICTPAWNAHQDAGRPFAQAIEERIRAHPQYAPQIAAYHTRWTEMISGQLAGTVDLLSELRERGHRLFALSNWSAETFPLVRNRFAFLDWFEQILLSGEVGYAKPDYRIYRIFLDRIHSEAAHCLFIDDSPENIAAARELGFATVLFRSPEQLRSELQALGLCCR